MLQRDVILGGSDGRWCNLMHWTLSARVGCCCVLHIKNCIVEQPKYNKDLYLGLLHCILHVGAYALKSQHDDDV